MPFGKQGFKYFIDYKDLYAYFFPEMSVYKRYSDETKYMYFMIKDEKHFHKYMKFGNIIKKSIVNLHITKNI